MDEEMVTFAKMPQMIETLLHEVVALRENLRQLIQPAEDRLEKQWFNVNELREYLPSHPRRQTIYSWTSTRRIPFHKKGRSIMFDKAEIDAWLQDNDYLKSIGDLDRDAEEFINRKRIINNKLK